MDTRFTDDIPRNTDGSDFIVRKRVPLITQICLVFGIAFVAIYLTACIMQDTGSKSLFFVTLTLTIGSLAWFMVFFSSRLRDLVLATEFQNAMLASAAQLSTRFCMITRHDGTIVYIDPGFQRIFPHFILTSDRNIEGLLRNARLPQEIVHKVTDIISQNRDDRVLLPFPYNEGSIMPIMMTIDVLPRPKGFFLLRGRDYVEKRNAAAPDSPLIKALESLPEGILVTHGGALIFANKTLEDWLGYVPGELMTYPIALNKILYRYDGSEAGELVQSNFEGRLALQRKDGSMLTLHIHQRPLGDLGGISATLRLLEDVKKK